MARKIVVTSGKGGVGKTTIVANLGYTLAKLGYKTLLVDMDFGLNNLDLLLGVENKIVYDLIDVIEGRCKPSQALIQDFFEQNLYVMPTSHSFCSMRFGAVTLSKIIADVEDGFDFVLIDCPAGIDGGFRRAVECADEYLVITTPHLSAVRDAIKVIGNLKSIKNISSSIVINRVRGDLIVSGDSLGVDAISECLNCKVVGTIPDDDEVSLQIYWGGRIDESSRVCRSVYMTAKNIITGEDNLYDCTLRYKGLLGSVRRKLRRRV